MRMQVKTAVKAYKFHFFKANSSKYHKLRIVYVIIGIYFDTSF